MAGVNEKISTIRKRSMQRQFSPQPNSVEGFYLISKSSIIHFSLVADEIESKGLIFSPGQIV